MTDTDRIEYESSDDIDRDDVLDEWDEYANDDL